MTKEELDRLDNEALNSLFYKRLFAEQEAYTAWLQTLPPTDILDNSYEYNARQDILFSLEENDLDNEQVKVMLEHNITLASLFKDLERRESSYMTEVWTVIEGCANRTIAEAANADSGKHKAAEMEKAKQAISNFCLRQYKEACSFEDLKNIGLASTTTDETEWLTVEVTADLLENKIWTFILCNDTNTRVAVSHNEFKSLNDMVENCLIGMGFDSITSLTDQEWEQFRFSREGRAWLNRTFPAGTRIHLEEMVNDPNPVPSGTKGTVLRIDDGGQIHMVWDNGRTLPLLYGQDLFSILPESEEEKV